MKLVDKFLNKKVRCEHRHTIDEHPACFAAGNIVDRRSEKEQLFTPWYKEPGMKICYADIETDGLKVDFGTTLAWCVKEKDGPIYYSQITKEELFDGENVDKRLINEILSVLSNYAIVVSYNGTRFDMSWLRAKAVRYGLDFPGFRQSIIKNKNGTTRNVIIPEIYHWDLYYLVRSKFYSLSSRSLANVTDYFGIEGKTPISKDTWRKAKYGDPEALTEVVEHCKGDVVILEELHNKVVPFAKWNKTGA